jgi:catechol 2,3-dioxygenase-like lactoylglutathione lyase family enzyme
MLASRWIVVPMTYVQLVAVYEYDPAIRFFVDVLHFELVEDSVAETTASQPKRWVVVRPPGAQTGLLLARADGERQSEFVGNQHGGRVGFFLRVDDFDTEYERLVTAGVEFVRLRRTEPYGHVAVFLDIAGNRWDLLGGCAMTESQREAKLSGGRNDAGRRTHRRDRTPSRARRPRLSWPAS